MKVSEHFYSIQGEGITAGTPAYFVRLQGCNLMCGGHNGNLVKAREATWWCDTEYVWKHGKNMTDEDLEEKMLDSGQLENILDGITHVVWTGGEPTLPQHQLDIVGFKKFLSGKHNVEMMYNELETNGTLPLHDDLYYMIDQINCSPKLSNSGMRDGRRIRPKVIQQINDHRNSWYKFVVTGEKDMEEIEEDFVIPLKIPQSRIILMPGVDSLKDLHDTTRYVFEIAKHHGYKCCSRYQVLAWDKTTGV